MEDVFCWLIWAKTKSELNLLMADGGFFYHKNKVELTPALEKKITDELKLDDDEGLKQLVKDVFQKLKDTLLEKGCIEKEEVD